MVAVLVAMSYPPKDREETARWVKQERTTVAVRFHEVWPGLYARGKRGSFLTKMNLRLSKTEERWRMRFGTRDVEGEGWPRKEAADADP
jgi:hypothetical protein